MNWFRNAHRYIQNEVKQEYSAIFTPQLLAHPFSVKGKYEVAYEYYYKNASSDLLNVGALMSKYFLDMAQKAGVVEEDNVKYCVKETFYAKEQDKDNPRMVIYLRPIPEEDKDDSIN